MALLEKDGNPNAVLHASDFTSAGETKSLATDLALVVGCATTDEAWVSSKRWNLLWSEADLLFQAPRPVTTFEGSYILEPNVQRFTIAKVVNSVVPQLVKGLFYQDPPMVLRPRKGTSEKTVEEKTTVMSVMLDACDFKSEVKWGMEQLAHLGTGIWKWGVHRVEKQVPRRIVDKVKTVDSAGGSETVHSDAPPKIEYTKKVHYYPFFESRPIGNVLIDASTPVGDIRRSGHAIDVYYADFYALRDLKNANVGQDGKPLPGWTWDEYWSDEKLKELWAPPVEAFETPALLRSDQTNTTVGVVHHAEQPTAVTSADPLAKKMEVLEYWDKKRKIIVINRRKVIFSGPNEFERLPFLSANWWNRPKALYGMGIGLTVGQNQRVDQGAINSILKILSFGVNPVYLRARDSNSPTQMIRTSIGKIISVDGEPEKAYKLLEQPRVPADVWAALENSEANTESTTGADQTLVQGSSAGPRAGIGRSATGAGAMAQASATRLDGPLDNFLNQVFVPFLYILDELIFKYVSDAQISDILGEELGKDYLQEIDMQEYHDGKVTFEVLAGSAMSARRTMTQALTLLTQFMQNPEFNEYLADMGKYIDWEVIFQMYFEASEWKNSQDVIKPLTPEMEKRRAAKLQQQQQGPMQTQMALNNQKADAKSKLEEQRSADRIKNDVVRFAVEHSVRDEATEGLAGNAGFGDVE
jgi:hypothetical protein